jgi:hypothetical protein
MRTQTQAPVSTSLYGACEEMFTGYPLAVETAGNDKILRAMILMVAAGTGGAEFFVLAYEDDSGGSSFRLHQRGAAAPAVLIETDGGTRDPAAAQDVLARGVPLPRHGSLFGWQQDGVVTVLIATYTDYSPEHPEPTWSALPLAGIPESAWPSFIGEEFGRWFWEHLQAGKIVNLAVAVAQARQMIFWVPDGTSGAGCIVVRDDLAGENGSVLPRGRYVYSEDLRAGLPVPPLEDLLADPGKTDLGPRF